MNCTKNEPSRAQRPAPTPVNTAKTPPHTRTAFLATDDPFHTYIADRFKRKINPDASTIYLADEFAYMKRQYTRKGNRVAHYMKDWFFGDGYNATEEGTRLVTLDPECSHCQALKKHLIATHGSENDYRLKGIHLCSTGRGDKMAWTVGNTCPFPHCFEYVRDPQWIEEYVAVGHTPPP